MLVYGGLEAQYTAHVASHEHRKCKTKQKVEEKNYNLPVFRKRAQDLQN